jgi:hypothetical protein
VLPQILAGGELGHDPLGAGGTDVGGLTVVVVGGAVAVVGAVVIVGFGAVVVGFGAVVVGCGAGAVVVGAVVVGFGAGAVVVGAVVVGFGAGAVVAGAVVGEGLVVGGTPVFVTVNSPRRLEVLPSAQVSTTLMRCIPLASLVVSYGRAVPLRAVPARSKGARLSVRTGDSVPDDVSR